MASRSKNNVRLKSMEEFKCKNTGLKFAIAALIVIVVSLLFFYRGSAFNKAAKAETPSIDLNTQVDTQQSKERETARTSEASNIVESEKSVENTESTIVVQNVELASHIEKSVHIDSALEVTPLTEQVYEDFIIPVTEDDINLVVMAVQHEVGSSRSFYPNADLDTIQQCMARVIINQVLEGRWGNSVSEILFYPGHFMDIERLWKYDPYEETTRKNVLTVLRGEDSLSSTITIEMSFSSTCTFDESIEIMESQVGPVIPYFWTVTAENRLLIFAEPDKSA